MKVLRTPDAQFENLLDYPFEPNYQEVTAEDGTPLRMHYLDEGPSDGPVVLLLHGEPSWSYLYRKMIPILVEGGCRTLTPDLVGFGKSDKPASRNDHSYQSHVDWLTQWVEKLDLKNITLFCQDWGGLLGLRIAAEHPERFAQIVAGNTMLPTGDQPFPEAFFKWQKYSQEVEVFPVGQVIRRGCAQDVSDEVVAAYDAPFPDESFKEGPRVMPALVPTSSDNPATPANRKAWETLSQWDKPFLTTFSDSDPITRGGDQIFQAIVPGTKGQPHRTIEGGGHFLQEDQGEAIAQIILDWMKAL